MNIFQRLFGKKKKVQETWNPETFEVYDSIDKRRRSQDDSYNTHYYGTATQRESPGHDDHQNGDGGGSGISGSWDSSSDSDSGSSDGGDGGGD